MRLPSNTEASSRRAHTHTHTHTHTDSAPAAPERTFEQINFVAERRGAVMEDDFYNKLKKLNVQAGKRDKILLARVQRICEAHDTVMVSYYQQIHTISKFCYQQIHGSSGADATTSMENIGEQVYV